MTVENTRLWFAEALLETGWACDVRLILSAGRIAKVETGVAAEPADERHQVALPGLPNLHSHAFQRAMAGLTEVRGQGDDSFWSWRELMYRFVDRLGPDDLEAVAAMAYAEMLETGFTRVGEFHYLHHDLEGRPYDDLAEMAGRIAAAADATGIGLTLLPVLYAYSGFGRADPTHGQRRFVNNLDTIIRLVEESRKALRALPDAVVGLAPHSLRAVDIDIHFKNLDTISGPIHIHVAEQVKEVEDCLAWSGARPVELLLDRAPVDPRWCLVHATHMTPEETRRLAASGAVAGLAPITEANLGDGLFPASDYLAAGGRFGVGSDSNVLIDAGEELRLLEYGQRLATRARNVFAAPGGSTGAALYSGTLKGGAQALGVEAGLKVGASADIVTLSGEGRGADGHLDAWIFARGRRIETVWRAGAKVVADARHIARPAIEARYRAALARLLA